MSSIQVRIQPAASVDIEGAVDWYDGQRAGLGDEFLDQLAATLERITEHPFLHEDLQKGIRRALLRRFP